MKEEKVAQKPNILIVDDELGPREAFRMLLEDEYNLNFACNGVEAFELVKEHKKLDLVIMDIKMPKMGGIETLKAMKEVRPNLEVLIVTGFATIETAMKAIHYGAYDYITKPFDKDAMFALVNKGLRRRKSSLKHEKLEENLQLVSQKLEQHYMETLESLITAVDVKDAYTSSHSAKVCEIVALIAGTMGLSEKESNVLQHAALLHDIGKIGISEQILKKKANLTEEEWKIIKEHPARGARILQPVRFLQPLVPIVLYHHERYDGTGYPEGKKEEEIPLGARIIAVADAYDAMISQRPYRHAYSILRVMTELEISAGKHFDSEVVKVMLDLIRKGKITLFREMRAETKVSQLSPITNNGLGVVK